MTQTVKIQSARVVRHFPILQIQRPRYDVCSIKSPSSPATASVVWTDRGLYARSSRKYFGVSIASSSVAVVPCISTDRIVSRTAEFHRFTLTHVAVNTALDYRDFQCLLIQDLHKK